jgi:phage terminase large subunit-like protein
MARAFGRSDRVDYPRWIESGVLKATDGNVTDYDVIREDIRELSEGFQIQSIAYDRWGATQLVTQLQEDGATCVPVGQGFATMSAPAKELEKLLLGKQIRHGGHPVLSWMASNVVAETDAAGNIKPSKKKSSEKIDGIVAIVMALSEAMRHTDQTGTSAYEDHPVTFLNY